MNIKRCLSLTKLLEKKSHFLFGPRGVGKSHLIKHTLFDCIIIDLLKDETYSRLLRNPSILEELIPLDQKKLVVIDEVQKIPALLDEVHRLIENRKITFLLTGSSSRKLRRGSANLLAGRAWEAKLFPFTSHELAEHFDLFRYLTYGGLPAVYFSDHADKELQNYIKLYLKEEIQAEGIVRRFDHFVRFLDVAALTSGEEVNFESIGSDAGVPARTVASFFEVLEDTLIGFLVPPFKYSKKRKAVTRSKFYLFDIGVTAALTKRAKIEANSELIGKAFEHFIALELRSFLSYRDSNESLCYWRTTSKHEVDLIVGKSLAIEVKATERVGDKHLNGLRAIGEEKIVERRILVSRDSMRRITKEGIEIIPWKEFLQDLWQGNIVKS